MTLTTQVVIVRLVRSFAISLVSTLERILLPRFTKSLGFIISSGRGCLLIFLCDAVNRLNKVRLHFFTAKAYTVSRRFGESSISLE